MLSPIPSHVFTLALAYFENLPIYLGWKHFGSIGLDMCVVIMAKDKAAAVSRQILTFP